VESWSICPITASGETLARRYCAVQPLSTSRMWPVIILDASEARNITAPATSSGSPNFPRGISNIAISANSDLPHFTSEFSPAQEAEHLYQFGWSDWVWEGEAPAEPGFVISGDNARPVTHYVLRFTFYGSAGASPSHTDQNDIDTRHRKPIDFSD
jgi:hypothetical protein